ncbi:MAG: 5'/3'-nucleotidase SurE [Gemmatimonadetes bacterium]|nr:5'/3'-nucleotidase SurE [Gemmatimonadota bacterium]MYB98866.1 5'/3'-nucleotidase SurE [Gemmatimonadota bacterium]
MRIHPRTFSRSPSTPILAFAAVAWLQVLLAGCAPPSPEAPPDTDQGPYHILVTNDDGIRSPGIQQLADALREVGEVTVVAPCGQRSGSSMSVQLGQGKRLRPITDEDRDLGNCVDGTPADAVMLAMEAVVPEGGFDLVVSGINAGANVGDLGHMSGTVGAAMAGAYYGVPSVAASLGGNEMDFGYAAAFMARFVEQLQRRPPLTGVVLSVNFPAASEEGTAGVAIGRMGGSYIRFGYEEVEPEDDVRVFRPRYDPAEKHPPGSDTEAFMAGMISIAPLRFDWTDEELLRELAGWGLDHRVSGVVEGR